MCNSFAIDPTAGQILQRNKLLPQDDFNIFKAKPKSISKGIIPALKMDLRLVCSGVGGLCYPNKSSKILNDNQTREITI